MIALRICPFSSFGTTLDFSLLFHTLLATDAVNMFVGLLVIVVRHGADVETQQIFGDDHVGNTFSTTKGGRIFD